MKNLKKVLALVIALTMVLTTVAFASYPDVDADANYASAVELLSALKILQGDENGNFNPDNTITRAEYAAVVCRALGMENAANSAKGATIFTDVAADHWATGYINLASQQGIVNGKGNGIFDPEGNVTYAEAVKMLVVALGYEPMASKRGGYPTGYLTVANSTKMTANVSSSGTDTAALRSTVAQLTANALEVPNMEQTGFGTDTKYEVLDKYDNYKTLLTQMDIYKATGVVESVDASDDTASVKLSEESDDYEFGYKNNKGDTYDDIKTVKALTFNINGSDIESYLQQNVDVYVYKAGKSDYDIVYVTSSGIGSSLKIESGDLKQGEATIFGSKKGVVQYYENSNATKTTKIDVEAKAPVYVNGADMKFDYTSDVDLYTLLSGKDAVIEFVENSDDKYYDMVLVTIYAHGIVDEVDAAKEKITFLGGNNTVKFDSSDSKQVVNIQDKDGNAMDLKDIKADDVLAMIVDGSNGAASVSAGVIRVDTPKQFNSNSQKITIIDLGNNTVTGAVDGSDDKIGDYKIDIDKTEYEVGVFVDGNRDKVYKISADSTKADEAKLGTEGKFYLDINGKVIGFDGTEGGNTTYGYILQTGFTNNGLDKGWEVKMLTQNDGIVTYKMNSSYTVNGTDGKSANDKNADATSADTFFKNFTDFRDAAATTTVKPIKNAADRIVEYKVTSDGKLKTVDKITDSATLDDKAEYRETTGKVGGKVLADDVVIFDLSAEDMDDATVRTISALVDEGTYEGFVADKDSSEYGLFVMTAGTAKFSADGGFFVVKGVKKSTLGDKDSYVVTYLDGEATDKTAIFTTEDSTASNGSAKFDAESSPIKQGDVFVANIDSDGVVSDYAILATLNADKKGFTVNNAAFAGAYGKDFDITTVKDLEDGVDYVYGYITDIDNRSGKQILTVRYGEGANDVFELPIDNATSQFAYTNAKNALVEGGDWAKDTGDEVEFTLDADGKPTTTVKECTAVFAKLYDGNVTDIYAINNRLTAAFVGKASK